MLTDYDAIAEDYRKAKQQPWRSAVESFTLLDLIGDPSGKAVVDLACGEGFYTRLLRSRGAARAVGVDLSAGMIDLARDQEAARPLGIDYVVQDGRDLHLDGPFDLAVAAYLLNYARTREELEAMCRGVAGCLRPGGRFVAVNSNPDLDFGRLPPFRRYGFELDADGPVGEGTPFTWTFHLDDGPLEVENYHLGTETHERALRASGFREIRWHGPRLSPEAEAADGRAYWAAFLDSSPIAFLECVK